MGVGVVRMIENRRSIIPAKVRTDAEASEKTRAEVLNESSVRIRKAEEEIQSGKKVVASSRMKAREIDALLTKQGN